MFGDSNMPNVDWDSSDLSGQPGMMKELMDDLMLSNHETENTRKDNLLDLVLTNNEFSINYNDIIENTQFSDHKTIITYIQVVWFYGV